MAKTGLSMQILESCRACQGTGIAGAANGYRIFCEECWGMKLVWIERCCLQDELYSDI